MSEIHGMGAFGIVPYLSEDLIKQLKYANIKTRAGKVAYLMALGDKAKKPEIRDGVHEARGALKWIEEVINNEK